MSANLTETNGADNHQRRANVVGRAFREKCRQLLIDYGFTQTGENEQLACGVEVEFVFDNQQDQSFFIQVVGTTEKSPRGRQPGLQRSDSVKKQVCNAVLTFDETNRPTLVLTSHMPDPASASGRMLLMARATCMFDVICVNDENDLKRLAAYARMDADELDRQADANWRSAREQIETMRPRHFWR